MTRFDGSNGCNRGPGYFSTRAIDLVTVRRLVLEYFLGSDDERGRDLRSDGREDDQPHHSEGTGPVP
jgi:hypothetical protein